MIEWFTCARCGDRAPRGFLDRTPDRWICINAPGWSALPGDDADEEWLCVPCQVAIGLQTRPHSQLVAMNAETRSRLYGVWPPSTARHLR